MRSLIACDIITDKAWSRWHAQRLGVAACVQKGWPTASDEGAERRRARSFEDEAHGSLEGPKRQEW